jgi:hypothetical protein
LEATETIVVLNEIRVLRKDGSRGKPRWTPEFTDTDFDTLLDRPFDPGYAPLCRMACQKIESEDPDAARDEAAQELREIVNTVGNPGKAGQDVRCVVSVAMLTEGWDANNVTHILGLPDCDFDRQASPPRPPPRP